MTDDYWKERIKAEQEAKIERDASLGDEMKRLYDYHFAEIEKEIRAFEQRYADKNGLTLAQVKERVSEMDVKAFEEKAKRYVAEKDFSAKANSELSLYNLKMRMKRLELLQYQMDLEMVALADSEHKMTEKFLNQEYVKELELQSGLLGRSVLSDGAIKQMAQATLNTPFKGATWSSRIWERQDELRYIAAKMTEDLLLKGKNPTDMIPRLRKEFNVSANEARRLAVTEGARLATEAQKQAFDANGYTEYEFISEPKACDICKPLDGKIFKVKDMEPGKNASPMHPWCRCSTAAHYSLSDKEYERIIRESAESMGVEYRSAKKMFASEDNQRYNESVNNFDLMAKSQLYIVGDRIRVSAKQIQGIQYDFWVQDNTKKIRDTVTNVTEALNNLEDAYQIPRIVFVKQSRLNAFAGYNQAQDILFISDILHSKREVSKLLADNYFAATDIEGVLKHELTHKQHWDSAKAFYKANKKRYNGVEQAMSDMNSGLISYVKTQQSQDMMYLHRISLNSLAAFEENNINELVAEVGVLGLDTSDKLLLDKVEEVLKWK